MLIALIVAAVTLGVPIGWLIDRHHTNHTNATYTVHKNGHTGKEEGK